MIDSGQVCVIRGRIHCTDPNGLMWPTFDVRERICTGGWTIVENREVVITITSRKNIHGLMTHLVVTHDHIGWTYGEFEP